MLPFIDVATSDSSLHSTQAVSSESQPVGATTAPAPRRSLARPPRAANRQSPKNAKRREDRKQNAEGKAGAYLLHRSFGRGSGKGQLVVQYDRYHKNKMEIVDMFVPENASTDSRIAVERKVVHFTRTGLPKNHVLNVVELDITPTSKKFQIRFLDGKPLTGWRTLDETSLPLVVSDIQKETLKAFTGVAVKLMTGEALPKQERVQDFKRLTPILTPDMAAAIKEKMHLDAKPATRNGKRKHRRPGFWKQRNPRKNGPGNVLEKAGGNS